MPVIRGRTGLSFALSGRAATAAAPQRKRISFLIMRFLSLLCICGPYFADFVEALAEALLEALVGGLVVGAAGEIVGEALHVGDFVFVVVGVLIAFPVANMFHQACGRVAQVQRDGISFGFVYVFEDFAVSGVQRVGFWRERKVHGGLRERQVAFGRTEKIESIFRGERDREGAGFGEANIFAGHAHQAASEVERVFAGFEHAREPVERGVGIGIAHRFVQRGDEIEVLFAGFVVAKKLALQDVFEQRRGDGKRAIALADSAARGQLQRVVRGAGIAVGVGRNAEKDFVAGLDVFVSTRDR